MTGLFFEVSYSAIAAREESNPMSRYDRSWSAEIGRWLREWWLTILISLILGGITCWAYSEELKDFFGNLGLIGRVIR